jgi:hypothetical protein
MTALSLLMQRQNAQLRERGISTGGEHAQLTGAISETLREVTEARTWQE